MTICRGSQARDVEKKPGERRRRSLGRKGGKTDEFRGKKTRK